MLKSVLRVQPIHRLRQELNALEIDWALFRNVTTLRQLRSSSYVSSKIKYFHWLRNPAVSLVNPPPIHHLIGSGIQALSLVERTNNSKAQTTDADAIIGWNLPPMADHNEAFKVQ